MNEQIYVIDFYSSKELKFLMKLAANMNTSNKYINQYDEPIDPAETYLWADIVSMSPTICFGYIDVNHFGIDNIEGFDFNEQKFVKVLTTLYYNSPQNPYFGLALIGKNDFLFLGSGFKHFSLRGLYEIFERQVYS